MQIKSTNSPSILKNLFLLLGGMVALVILSATIFKNQASGDKSEASMADNLSSSTIEFMDRTSTLPEVLSFFKNHTIYLAVKDEASASLSQKMRDKLADFGSAELPELGLRHSYAGVFKDGNFIKEKRSEKEVVSLEFENGTVTSAGYTGGNHCHLQLNGSQFDATERGLNVFVLSETGQLAGIWNFDFFENENPKSAATRSEIMALSGVPTIEIELKEKHFAKLKKKRDEALAADVLMVTEDDLVPAKLFYEGEKFKADIRLKGDWTDHLEGDNWSFRVKLDKAQTLMGMRKFSLHRPQTRNYVGEWLFHQLLADADIPNLQYHFVQVRLRVTGSNGKTEKLLGLYALEEFFDKHLIERSQRREGVILKVDEDPIWQERADFIARGLDLGDLTYVRLADYENAEILPFGESRIRQDSSLLRQFLTGSKLFKDYLSKKRPIHEVFDVKKLAKFNAICNLLGANHALIAHNYRVYYNPVTSLLEPVGFDGNAWHKVWYFYPYLHANEDPVYLAAHAQALEEVTSDAYFQKVLNWPGLENQMALMKQVYPQLKLTPDMLKHNRQVIRKNLHPDRCLKVHFNKMEDGYMHLTVENFGKYPVQISALQNSGKRVFGTPNDDGIVDQNERRSIAFELDKNFDRLFVQKKKMKSKFEPLQDMPGLNISFNLLGINELKTEKILPWNADLAYKAEEDPFRAKPNADQYDFLVFDEKQKTITCKQGLWRVGGQLIIPRGYLFRAGPGCRIELVNSGSKIISHSALSFIGSEEEPVEIFSSTGKGRGILVVNPGDTSDFKYCRFAGLSNPVTSGWALTGAVNFYEAPVRLSNCSFTENRCEDALNIFRSWFEMDGVIFTDIHADAFDGDFVNGVVSNCQFGRIGNDAIDVSGSDILVENVVIVEVGDKGLSAGENSQLIARNVVIKNSAIAIASKDKSLLKISHSLLKVNDLAFTAFQKKPEFGPAKIEADSLTLSGNATEFLIETKSSLLLNGQFMPTVDGVIERMYGEEFGRKSER